MKNMFLPTIAKLPKRLSLSRFLELLWRANFLYYCDRLRLSFVTFWFLFKSTFSSENNSKNSEAYRLSQKLCLENFEKKFLVLIWLPKIIFYDLTAIDINIFLQQHEKKSLWLNWSRILPILKSAFILFLIFNIN